MFSNISVRLFLNRPVLRLYPTAITLGSLSWVDFGAITKLDPGRVLNHNRYLDENGFGIFSHGYVQNNPASDYLL